MLIPVLNENEEIIGHKERNGIQPEDIYMVSSLRVVNELGETLLTQRAATKKNDPDKRTSAVAGTVEKGETFETNIIKETQEEIGIAIKNPILLLKRRISGNHNYFGAIFYQQLAKSTNFTFDAEEIQAVLRMSKAEIDEWLAKRPEDFVPPFPEIWKLVNEKLKELGL